MVVDHFSRLHQDLGVNGEKELPINDGFLDKQLPKNLCNGSPLVGRLC